MLQLTTEVRIYCGHFGSFSLSFVWFVQCSKSCVIRASCLYNLNVFTAVFMSKSLYCYAHHTPATYSNCLGLSRHPFCLWSNKPGLIVFLIKWSHIVKTIMKLKLGLNALIRQISKLLPDKWRGVRPICSSLTQIWSEYDLNIIMCTSTSQDSYMVLRPHTTNGIHTQNVSCIKGQRVGCHIESWSLTSSNAERYIVGKQPCAHTLA